MLNRAPLFQTSRPASEILSKQIRSTKLMLETAFLNGMILMVVADQRSVKKHDLINYEMKKNL